MEEFHQHPLLLPLIGLEKAIQVHMREATGDRTDVLLEPALLRGLPQLGQGAIQIGDWRGQLTGYGCLELSSKSSELLADLRRDSPHPKKLISKGIQG